MDSFPNINILIKTADSFTNKAEYVLRTFCSILRLNPRFYYGSSYDQIHIYYGIETKNSYPLKIYYNPEAVAFYEKNDVYPVSKLRFNKYKDNYIPFLFSKQGDIFSASLQHAVVRKDLISSAFYFLSCWHERVLMDKAEIDNRFDFYRSLQYQGGFVELPVVDIYANILKSIIEVILPEFSRETLWGERKKFYVTVSHDVDYWNYWTKEHYAYTFKYNAKRLLKQPINSAYKLIGHALRRFLSHSYTRMRHLVRGEEYRNINSTYFLITGDLDDKYRLPSKKVIQYENNRHAYFKKPKYRTQIEGLLQEHDVQLHGTPKSSFNSEILKDELSLLNELGKPVKGYRSHTLSFDYHKSFDVLEKMNISYDSTIGFWEAIGYRCGTAYPFFPFNFKENRPYHILEIPLTVMDTSMMSSVCMNLTPWQAYLKLRKLVKNAEKYGSHLNILWHNTTFEKVDYPFWGWVFWAIIRYARRRDGLIMSLSDLYHIWSTR
ncbi:MAG: hypothetical protein JXR56_02050 [Candidatus Cloacimonetes bacterium]|nr:hypothetical protein [Candidatus Cloacimonadota bacterium]